MSWKKLKNLIQSIKPADFEKLVARLLELHLEIPFVVARSGDQPRGDARSMSGDVSMQAKRYTGEKPPNAKTIEGDIREAIRESPHLQVYVLAVTRDTEQLSHTLDAIARETGLDIVTLELSDGLSELGALCVTFWKDICPFFESSDHYQDQELLTWVGEMRDDSRTKEEIIKVRLKLEYGVQTQRHVQEVAKKHLLERFSTNKGFNPINLSQSIKRDSLESKISDWWETQGTSVCCLEGKEGTGKTWLAAGWVNSIYENQNIVTFWLDSKDWKGHKSIYDLLYTCFSLIYPSYEQGKIAKLQNKPAKIWRKTLIVLDGVNERGAIEAAQRILDEYLKPGSEWRGRIRFLLTTRPLDNYPDFENYLWNECHKISVVPFDDSELQEALTRKGLRLADLPDSLKNTARIPRYFQTCVQLRHQFGSFRSVTTTLVLWADLLGKIERTDPQIKQKLGWHHAKDAQEILSDLAKQAKWTNVDTAPQAPAQLLGEYFPYREVRHDLEEQRIALEAGPLHAKLSKNHIILGWAFYLSNLFDRTEFIGIKDFAENFQNALEPIPSEDLRTEALFIALQISAISPNPDISQDQLSQKRAALILAWSNSHNASIIDKRLSFWTEEDPDAYAQVVEVEFENHNVSKYEEMLIEPLARAWLNKGDQIERLASRLIKWLLPRYSVNSPENRIHKDFKGLQVPVTRYDPQVQLSAAALSILSQRPERQFLETLARCYAILDSYKSPDENIDRLMRWGYTEAVLDDLCLLAKQGQTDEVLLKGIYGLADGFRMDLPIDLERPLSEEDRERNARIEEWHLSSFVNRIRNQEKLLTGDSPAANANRGYHGLDYLAVRKDLPDLCSEDQDEIRKILHHISVSPEPKLNRDLISWIAKYAPESYSKFACNFKISALNPECPRHMLRATEELIFQQNDCERITDAILEMKQCLTQGDDSTLERPHLLTDILLFSASEDKLIGWFEFLAVHKSLRVSICYETTSMLLKRLLPRSIVTMAQQKLEVLGPSTPDNRSISDDTSKELSELEYWSALYAYGTEINENVVTWAFEELKLRKPDSIATYPLLQLALSDPKRFLDEILTDEKVREHLFCKDSIRVIVPIYEGKDVSSYETLIPLLPLEIVGSFLCQPDRHSDLSRWGKELMERMFSIVQGDEVSRNSVEELRFAVNPVVLQIWAEQNETDFSNLASKYLTGLSKSPWYRQPLRDFTNVVFCLLLRFRPDIGRQYYHQWNAKDTVNEYKATNFLHQLWQVEQCNSPKHCQFRCELLEACLNDEEIMFMSLIALAWGGKEELWDLVRKRYLESDYAKERNLGVSILPWFGTCDAIKELERLISDDQSKWVRDHATWAYEVAQQERSCRKVYREVLQTGDPFQISAVFEQIKPALSPTAQWWHYQIESEEKLYEESKDCNPKLLALVERFWYQWENSLETKSNFEIFGRKLREYCRGEKFLVGRTPRIAPWWKPASNSEN